MIAGSMRCVRPNNLYLLILCFLWYGYSCPAQAAQSAERQLFQQAREALKHNQLTKFNHLYAQLEDYPLRPYLDIWRYWNVLDDPRNDARVARILEAYADIPEANDLRIRWIKALAARQQWLAVADQLTQVPGTFPDMRITLLSLWHNGKKQAAVKGYTHYWRKVNKADGRLKMIEQRWRKNGHPTADDLWARIKRQVKRGQWKKAMKTAAALRASDRKWLRYWRDVQRDPAKWLPQPPQTKLPQPYMAAIFDDGLRRLASRDVLLSYRIFQHHLKPRLAAVHQGRLMRKIALRAAFQHRLEAINWLTSLPAAYQTDATRTWPARLLLLHHRWRAALAAINALPQHIRRKETSRWNYWRARCLLATSQTQAARKIFRQLATERGYYSFLAVDQLNSAYHIATKKKPANAKAIRELLSIPAMQRAREWIALKQQNKAYREWALAMHGRSQTQWHAAMILANRWQWPSQALRAASRAGAHDRLDIRFPMAFADAVIRRATQHGLSASLVWSVIRQESLFNPEAISPAGAIGLMQLMPATARVIAKNFPQLGRHPDLTVPETNITLGTAYLAARLKQFDGHIPLALASYNAGPHRVRQWLKATPFHEPELWIEAIPFNETRNYVQRILAYQVIYDWRSGQRKRLSVLHRQVRIG